MRALLLLPLLAAGALPQPPTPPPALLVLRAACSSRAPPHAEPGLRVLPRHDTCGPGWREAVTREGLRALSAGAPVALAGWAGVAACDALAAAARALGAARPAACALPAARAAAAAWLAARLGWRSALLPPKSAPRECRAATRPARRALAAAALALVEYPESPNADYHVEILCSPVERGDERARPTRRGALALLLHLPPDELFDRRDPTSSGNETTEPQTETTAQISERPKTGTRSVTPSTDPGADLYGLTNSTDGRRSEDTASRRSSLDRLLAQVDATLPERRVLVLSEEELTATESERDAERAYERAAEEVRRARAGRIEPALFTFYVYGRAPEPRRWSLLAVIHTASLPAPDDARDWHTEVRHYNVSGELTALGAPSRAQGGGPAPAQAALAALSACGALGAAAAVAAAVRWAAARRRRRRRGADVLLAASDLSFPADERRRVGEGMETMLSCWLQQLREFGGPDPERPDALRVPSAPSSTCSVNRVALDRRVRYKGDAVYVKWLLAEREDGAGVAPRKKAVDALTLMQSLRHENLNPFIGYVCAGADGGPALVWDHCGRGSLEDVLMADDIKLDWTFRLSLLTDLVRGMRYLHGSALRVHGRLTSRNCAVDSRWVLRITDYGLPALRRAGLAGAGGAGSAAARALLWTAPELLRDEAARARGSQPGDVYSFGIIMQEVIVRGEPYCMLALTPEEIVEKLRRPPPLIRPSVSMGAAPPEAVSVMRQCWSEAPDLRPDFHRLHDLFRHLHRGRKVNIVDSMFEMLEKYSNNLEELIRERTEQLDMEKRKTEQLLNRMLPRSVAERLLLGQRVEPEEFSEVSIYFSDIVGFTALAARSTPVQVVDLLNDLYTTFDAAIERYSVYKVETIGDAYMVVGGLPARAPDHAQAVATMALHLLHLAGRFRVRHLPDTPLHLRIGLHSGPVCAAVVGLTMPRYCLFGDTVNTASRMESTGAAWRIQVSATTAELLAAAGGYRLRSRGLVDIKGKGAMHTYWLLGKDGFDRPLPTPPPLPSEEVLFEAEGETESEASSGAPAAAPERRSGAVSADSSPPAPARLVSAVSVERARYRRGGGAGPALRRQWSLETERAAGAAPGPRPPRYRTRPAPPEEPP